jgi:hypothetical protein
LCLKILIYFVVELRITRLVTVTGYYRVARCNPDLLWELVLLKFNLALLYDNKEALWHPWRCFARIFMQSLLQKSDSATHTQRGGSIVNLQTGATAEDNVCDCRRFNGRIDKGPNLLPPRPTLASH